MGRPKSDNPKDGVLNFRIYSALRVELERFAREEKRSLSRMADLLLREAVVARMKKEKRNPSAIEELP